MMLLLIISIIIFEPNRCPNRKDLIYSNIGRFDVFTGETSSGKSSLANLMLGKEILPSSSDGTTSNICELKYGEKPKLVAHFKDKDPETGERTRTVLLEEPTRSSQESYLEQISPYVKRGYNLKKVELFWPHPFLKVIFCETLLLILRIPSNLCKQSLIQINFEQHRTH